MKNGDCRSAKWVARHLRGYKRDNERTQSMAMLVDLKDIPLPTVAGWSDEQCLLAEDWIAACHFSASDNNNRVPAMPPFLAEYRGRPYDGTV